VTATNRKGASPATTPGETPQPITRAEQLYVLPSQDTTQARPKDVPHSSFRRDIENWTTAELIAFQYELSLESLWEARVGGRDSETLAKVDTLIREIQAELDRRGKVRCLSMSTLERKPWYWLDSYEMRGTPSRRLKDLSAMSESMATWCAANDQPEPARDWSWRGERMTDELERRERERRWADSI